jgi:hypothetical protein
MTWLVSCSLWVDVLIAKAWNAGGIPADMAIDAKTKKRPVKFNTGVNWILDLRGTLLSSGRSHWSVGNDIFEVIC